MFLTTLLYDILSPLTYTFAFIINLVLPYSVIDYLYSYEITPSLTVRKRNTDFDKVLEFNKLFNVPQVSITKSENENEIILINGFALITEEFNELKTAVEQDNKIEIKDALCDLVYVIYGLLYRINMTSNAKLNDIASCFLYNRAHVFNPFNDLYRYIKFNKCMAKVLNIYNLGCFTNKTVSPSVLLEISSYLNLERELQKLEKSSYIFNDLKTLQKLEELIKNVERNVNIADKISFGYTEYALSYSLVDLLLEVYVIGDLMFDFKSNFDIVHRSNMSKICSSEIEAKATVSSYKLRYESGEVSYDSPYYERIAEDKWMVRNRSTQKVLKNINYKPVEEFPGWLE
jgi:predicted HAD superfamily Cof-like phosphohydrolase